VRTVHTGRNPKYCGISRGVFRLLGYRFCPRLADIGGARFWRIDPQADYGQLNSLARQSIKLDWITPHWDDMLRTAGSLKLGRVSATGIMRTLQVGDQPTRLAQAFAEFGRIDKTTHMLTRLDDETKRRATLVQLNRGEKRHSLARTVFHGKRGELRQRYREGQEYLLGALGLVVNVVVLWSNFEPKVTPCSMRLLYIYRHSTTTTSICWGATHLSCQRRSLAASSGHSGTQLRTVLKPVLRSIAPQTSYCPRTSSFFWLWL
jgi:hypothetical protein